MPSDRVLPAAWIAAARAAFGDRLVLDPAVLAGYDGDEYPRPDYRRVPAALVRPETGEEVAAAVRLCSEHGVPVTVRGGGTGLAAGCVAAPGGIVLSMERMNRLVDADPANLAITVQAGMPLRDLYGHVQRMGLYFPPHPGDEGAHVGGAVAANAGGARAVKYGTVRRFVLGLRVVLASGETIALGGPYVKSSTGYHLAELFAGSEGTLGVITEVTLGLLPPVGSVLTLVAPFASATAAIGSVPGLLRAGLLPCAVEFIEHPVLRAAERRTGASWPARSGEASLMVILDGRDEDDTLAQARAVGEVLEGAGAGEVIAVGDRARQADVLAVRSGLYETLRPHMAETFDACVPRSAVAGHVAFIHALAGRRGVSLPTYGHAADGNVHTHLLRTSLHDGEFGPEIPGWQDLVAPVTQEIYGDVTRRGGVISGEHGIGRARRSALARSLAPAHLAALRAVKQALDPRGVLNPGALFEA